MSHSVSRPTKRVKGRLAPSPTGGQHLGNARTYLLAWLSARSQQGEIQLRIEDIDKTRVRAEAISLIIEDLKWLGLTWDEGPIMQSSRYSRHQEALERLMKQGVVFPCTCTRKDILTASSAPHLEEAEPVYPGTCRNRSLQQAQQLGRENQRFSWRFRVQESPEFTDGFLGKVQLDLQQHGGDFIVWKQSGEPAYQLAVAVDDGELGITEVVRGDDLLSSTPRQLLIYRALGLPEPKFYHVPLVVDATGRRLAKRSNDLRLVTLRERGISAEQILGWLGYSCGWLEHPRPISLPELLPLFSWQSVPKTPFVMPDDFLSSV